ncbi:MAG: hypothetical protein ABJJ37_27145 [Roseibium sp.]
MDCPGDIFADQERTADLEAALDMAALLVQRFGTDYLPFFVALEKNLRELLISQEAIYRALKRSQISKHQKL